MKPEEREKLLGLFAASTVVFSDVRRRNNQTKGPVSEEWKAVANAAEKLNSRCKSYIVDDTCSDDELRKIDQEMHALNELHLTALSG